MIDYQLDPIRKIAVTRVTGPFTFADLANHLHRLVRDRGFQPDFDSLIVAANLAAVPQPSSIAALAPLARAWSSRRKGARWAIVVPNEQSRAFAERAVREVRLTDVTVQCFHDEPAAAAWLEAHRGAAHSILAP